ncbi:MAG: thioredoxin domain-containing protein [Epsilonproteobacteria bacterium]|nr:thioredoxin domain-containing protein [Campylobacterota bacterium]
MRLRLLFLAAYGMVVSHTLHASNSLINSSSPYLRQHADNPIDWVAWDETILKRAQREHKPIFLSIGYSTCHWCHVMARESFENENIAQIINTYFIPVKIDREEETHIDSYYQRLHRMIKGRSGGWPLHAILTEEGGLFWIGTYVPPHTDEGIEGMESLMKRLGEGYRKDPNKYREQSKNMATIESLPITKEAITPQKIFDSVASNYDSLYKGFGKAPKFPEASKISLLLDLGAMGNDSAQKMGLDILRTMALSGLYDQVEGGFFRYSTDAGWEIPHFEKMLYNQAELIPLYVRAYRLTQDSLYADIVRETIAMTHHRFGNHGLFYSASDAESNHEEGGYFIYNDKELESLHLSQSNKEALSIKDGANFEGKYHLHLRNMARPKGFETLQRQLSELRRDRPYPFIDTKIITSWNAMMIKALYCASAIDPSYTKVADQSLAKLLVAHRINGVLYHQSVEGYPLEQKALLEDYSFLISALLTGYQVTLDEEKLQLAKTLCDEAIGKFYTSKGWMQNSEGMKIEVDLLDKYTTSAYGMMIQNLHILAVLGEETRYEWLAKKSLDQTPFLDPSLNAPSSMIGWLMGHYGVTTLSHTKEILVANRKKIENMGLPYLYLHAENRDDFGACTVNGCFANDNDLENIRKILLMPH